MMKVMHIKSQNTLKGLVFGFVFLAKIKRRGISDANFNQCRKAPCANLKRIGTFKLRSLYQQIVMVANKLIDPKNNNLVKNTLANANSG